VAERTIATTLLGQSPTASRPKLPERSPRAEEGPAIDIEKFVRDRYGSLTQPLMVVL